MAAEIGPLAIFLITYNRTDLQTAIISLMITAPIGVVLYWFVEKKWPFMLLLGAAMVLIFGAASSYFENNDIFKMKPTFAYILFTALLGGGLLFGKNFIKLLLGSSLTLREPGWRYLAIAWAVFFLLMAGLNEFVWRNFSEDFWVKFKVIGFISITLVFGLALTPIILKYKVDEEES